MNYEDINILVAYCARCGRDIGIATKITRQSSLNEYFYNCLCGHKGNCGEAIIQKENKEA